MTTKINIIPSPKSISLFAGNQARVTISAEISALSDSFRSACRAFSDIVKKVHDIDMKDGEEIVVRENASLANGEYTLSVTDSVLIEAGDLNGATYALSTLVQIMEKCDAGISLPMVEISDKPDCEYRALMVDLARQWHPFSTLLNYVDLCYLYKIKFLHLHFTDSPSYTLPSDKFPKIPTPDRHYTKEQIAELNEYAKAKNIEIIPEFDVPGHARPMVTAYPELFANVPTGVESEEEFALFFADIKQNVICVGKEGVMDTLKVLAKEIIDMFPYSRYLHIGGDEANIGEWKNCRTCQEYMQEHGIDGPRPLYTHFIKLMTDIVLDLGKTPIVWEGFPREGSEEISRDVIVTAWESYYHLAPELIEEGFKITNASWEPLYTVPAGHRVVESGRWYPDDIMDWNLYTWKNWNQKTAAYEKPIVIEPTEQVLGATFCAWENNYDAEINTVRENLAAMSEKVWNINSTVTGEEMKASLEKILPLAEKLT